MSRSLLAASFALSCATAGAATINVTRFDDPAPFDCAVDGCTLREAAIAAGQTPEADTIVLAPGEYALDPQGGFANIELQLPSGVTLLGTNANTTSIRGHGAGSMFRLGNGSVTFRRVTIRDGFAGANLDVSTKGGAIRAYQTTLVLDQVVLRDNRGLQGGAIFANESNVSLRYATITGNTSGQGGGGVHLVDSQMTVYRSTLDSNTGYTGGAISAQRSPVRIQAGSSIRNNTAGHSGGAAVSDDEFVADDDTLISGNAAPDGGAFSGFGANFAVRGVATSGGTGLLRVTGNFTTAPAGFGGAIFVGPDGATLERLEISGNDATYGGGAIYSAQGALSIRDSRIFDNSAGSYGGGLQTFETVLDMQRVSIQGNHAGIGGGAMTLSGGGRATLVNVDIYGNTGTTETGGIRNNDSLLLSHVTMWNNTSNGGRDAVQQISNGSTSFSNSVMLGRCTGSTVLITAAGKNLRTSEPSNACPGSTSFLPLSLARGTYGGLFEISGTNAANSPLVDGGHGSYCVPVDIRNRNRVSRCDLGAFEFGAH